MVETMTPEEIENARFTVVNEGFDRDEVEVFLKAVAADVRALQRSLPATSERPYHDLGREVAELLQHALDSARRIKEEVQREITTLMQDAQRTAKRARDDAEQIVKRAEKEAGVVREEAFGAAERYREQAEKAHRLAEAERSIAEQEAHREAKRLRDEAKRQAHEILARAKGEAAERTVDSERRLRRLQEAEVAMRRRIALLQSKLEQLSTRVGRDAEGPATIRLDEGPDGNSTNGAPATRSGTAPRSETAEE